MSKIDDRQQQPGVGDPLVRVAGHLFVPVGTTGNRVIATAGRWYSQIMRRAIGVDGENDLFADGDSFTINNGSADDYARVRSWQTLPVVQNDCLLPHVEIPARMGAGAARQRFLGHLRYHTKRAAFATQIRDMVRLTMDHSEAVGAGQVTICHVHFVSTMVGGTGAGCLPIAVLDTIAAIHEELPSVHVYATAHLLGAKCFDGLSREKERKMQRSTDGLLKELIYLQNRDNLLDFADKMEVYLPDSRDRLLDGIVEYFGSNSRNVTFSMPETFARVAANIQASFNSAWSSWHIEREECNANGRCDLSPLHIVSNAQASIAAIPSVLPRWFANRWLLGAVEPLLAQGDVSHLTTEVEEAFEALNVEGGFKKATGNAYRQLGSGILEDAKAMPDEEIGVDALTASLERRHERIRKSVASYFGQHAKKKAASWVVDLSGQHTSIGKLRSLVQQVGHRLGEAKARAQAGAEELDKATADGPIKKRGFFRSHSGLVDFLQSQIDAFYYKTAAEVIAIYIAAVEAWAEKLQAIAEAIRVAAVRARNEVGKTQESMRTDSASIVNASEIGRLPALLHEYLAERGESMPTAPLKAVVQDNAARLLTEGAQQVAESLRRQLAGESVSSFCGALKLKFDPASWFKQQVESLGGTSPLVAALIPQEEVEQTVVVAAGADFALVERVLQENPRLGHQLEKILGTESGSLLVVRGYHHAPIDGMASRAPAARAVAEFRRRYPSHGKGKKLLLDELETSCGALLPAHDADSPGQDACSGGRGRVLSPPPSTRNGPARVTASRDDL